MVFRNRREQIILGATAFLAVGGSLGAAAAVRVRTDDLAERLTAAGGVPARIGCVDADLTGAIRLTDVALGDLVSVDAIEASVAMGSLLAGELRADEIRVDAPHVAIRVEANGDSDAARLARRLVRHGTGTKPAGTGDRRLRRIVVAEGTLTAAIAGIGELSADDVELVPDAAGVRIVTGRVRLRSSKRQVTAQVAFSRAAAELSLPHMRFGRVLAVGGAGTVMIDDSRAGTIALRELAAGRLSAAGALEVHASIDDGGVTRPLALHISPIDYAVTLRGHHIPLAPIASLLPASLGVTHARATGTVTIRRRPRALELAADGALEALVIDHRRIAAAPVMLDAATRANITITPDAFAVTNAAVELGAVRLSATGWVRRGSPVSGQLDLQLAQAPCAALLSSLPVDLRGALDGLGLDGTLGARARLSIDLAAPPGEGVTLASSITGACGVTAEPPAADVTTLAEDGDQQLADGSRRRIARDDDNFVSLKRLPRHVSRAFVSAEDGRFFDHDGFDLEQIARSLEIDLREHRLARGGSTISQQLIKNAFLTQRRSFDRKLQEAILTWRLEDRLDKHQILERYLNIIELGPRTFGIRDAARFWFNVSPRELTIRQAAFLAALTSQPTAMTRRVRRAGSLDPASAERVAVILRAMKRDGVIDADEYEEAKTSSMRFAATAIPPER